VCCSVLQCVAVCGSVLQYVAVCCSVLQCVAVCCSVCCGVSHSETCRFLLCTFHNVLFVKREMFIPSLFRNTKERARCSTERFSLSFFFFVFLGEIQGISEAMLMSRIQEMWHTYMCAMTHTCVWHDSFICVLWLIHMCAMTYSYVWQDSWICVPWLIHMCAMNHAYVCHDSCIFVPWLMHMSAMTYSYVCHDTFTCVCHDSLTYVWYDSLICAMTPRCMLRVHTDAVR